MFIYVFYNPLFVSISVILLFIGGVETDSSRLRDFCLVNLFSVIPISFGGGHREGVVFALYPISGVARDGPGCLNTFWCRNDTVGLIGGAVWLLSGDKAKELKGRINQRKKRLLIFVVAYNAQHTINNSGRVPTSLTKELDAEILVIDDQSEDNIFERAKYSLRVVRVNSNYRII